MIEFGIYMAIGFWLTKDTYGADESMAHKFWSAVFWPGGVIVIMLAYLIGDKR